MALALNGTPVQVTSTTTDQAVTAITTTLPAVWCVISEINGITSGSITSITDTAGLTWYRRSLCQNVNNTLELWYAVATTSKAANTITVHLGGSLFNATTAFAVSGVDLTYPWDTHTSVPTTGPTAIQSVSTIANDTFIIGSYRTGSEANPTEGAGFTKIFGANFQLVEYKVVAAPQSALSITIGTGNGTQNGGLADALVADTQGLTTLEIDGIQEATGSSTSLALPALSTRNPGVVVLGAEINHGSVSSITDTAGLTWLFRAKSDDGTFTCEEWYAISNSALSGNVITIHGTGSVDFITGCAFNIAGANRTTPWDVNGAIPITGLTDATVSVSTTATDTMLIGIYRQNNGLSTQGTGFQLICARDFLLVETKHVITTQSGTSLSVVDRGAINGAVGDAIVKAPAVITPRMLGLNPEIFKVFII